jgi:gluconate 2-dehydrogenase gamma chain
VDELHRTRRDLLFALGGLSASAWLASVWPQIAAAAGHAAHATTAVPTTFAFFNTADAADVDAISARILPGGESPGAREAHVVYFIDHALATFFAELAPAFRAGLREFQQSFKAAHPLATSFAAAGVTEQVAFLTLVEHSPFFDMARMFTILGTLSASQYGGNHAGVGWKLMGFEDQHVFTPPFGYYDLDYPGFHAVSDGGVR